MELFYPYKVGWKLKMVNSYFFPTREWFLNKLGSVLPVYPKGYFGLLCVQLKFFNIWY